MSSGTSVEPQSRPYLLVLVALVAAEATGAFEAAMLTAAVPKLIAEFDITTTDVGWAFAGFMLMIAAAAAIGGKLGDLFGRKKVLIIVLLLSILGSVVSLAVGTFPAIVIGRTIQGVSGAVLPLIMGIAREAVEPKRVPVAMALVSGTALLAGALGFFVSGVLIQYTTWHAIFIAAAILAALAAVLCQVCLNRSPVTHVQGQKIDLVGGLLFVPALTLILYGVTSSQTRGWASPIVLGCIFSGVAVGVFWVWWELRVATPLLDLRLLAMPKYALTMGIVAFLAFGAIGGMSLVQPILFQGPTTAPVGLGLTPTQFGVTTLVVAVLGFAFAPLSGVVARRAGAKRSMALGMAILTAGMPCFYLMRDSLPLIVVLMLVASAGTTFALTSIPNLLAEVLPKENMSEGMGFSVVIRSLFQAVSISVFALALSSSVVPGTQLPQLGAYGLAIAVGAVGTAVGLALVFLVRSGGRSVEPASGTGAALAMTQD